MTEMEEPEIDSAVRNALSAFRARGSLSVNAEVTLLTQTSGLNNTVFRAVDGAREFAMRLCPPDEALGLDRASEVAALTAARAHGVAPRLADAVSGALLLEWLPGDTFSVQLDRSRERAHMLGSLVRGMHALKIPENLATTAEIVSRMASSAESLGAALPGNLDRLLVRLRIHDEELQSTVLVHHDLWPNNVVVDGEKCWAIDWEFAGTGSRAIDLVTLMDHADEQSRQAFLAAYGTEVSELEFTRARFAVALFEASWASVMARRSPEPRGFAAHARTMFAKATELTESM